MRKPLLFLGVMLIFISCDQKPSQPSQSDLDYKKFSDSLSKAVKLETLKSDSIKIANAPVVIVKARIVQPENSRFKDIEIKYKNTTKHKVTAIRFKWHGVNAFGEPAEMGSLSVRGEGGGFTDSPLSAGKSRTDTWSLVSENAKTITDIMATEVVFEDGSKWRYNK